MTIWKQATEWERAQEWERAWHGTCQNTFGEEEKQFHYAKKMGLKIYHDSQGPYLDMSQLSILDIGGGSVSLLLKCRNLKYGMVVDPCEYPEWVYERYACASINTLKIKAENLELDQIFDEAWIYNVLQHVDDPELVIKNTKKYSKIIRVFDWLEISGVGHPHYLTEQNMDKWFDGAGKVEIGNGGKEYFGIFRGDHYV